MGRLCLTDRTQGKKHEGLSRGGVACCAPSRHFPPVVVSLLANQASCLQHLRPLSISSGKTSQVKIQNVRFGWVTAASSALSYFFPVVMDEEYYSGGGDWEGTDGNLVRTDLLRLVWLFTLHS